MEGRAYERTVYEAKLDVSYNVLLQQMQEVLFARINRLIAIFSLIAGSAAFAGVLAKLPGLVSVAGVLVAVGTILGATNDLAGRAERHRIQRRRYAELAAADPVEIAEIDRKLAAIGVDDLPPWESLEVAAYNSNLMRNGRDDFVMPEGRMVWLVRLLT